MPRKPHAASCIVGSLSTNLTNQYRGLWVTDALLAETFQRFIQSPRRYGSNVPGPLEARRRASKRKNTSLAYTGSPGVPVHDTAMMLGTGAGDRWWKKVEDAPSKFGQPEVLEHNANTEQSTHSLLPSWLLGSSEGTPVRKDQKQAMYAVDDLPNDLGGKLETRNVEQDFEPLVARTTDLNAIRALMKRMKINLREQPRLSEAVFRQLVKLRKRRGPYKGLVEALHDPSLHPPSSKNHVFFIKYCLQSRLTWKEWVLAPFPALLKAIELGLMSPQSLQEIIFLIAEIHDNMPTSQGKNRLISEWHRLLTAVEQSRVLRMDDLDPKFLSVWYQRITQAPWTDTTCLLLWRLRPYSGLTEAELGGELAMARMTQSFEAEECLSGKMIKWLASLPNQLQGPVIVQATFKMLNASLRGEGNLVQVIGEWSAILPQLHSENLEFHIDRSMWAQVSGAAERLSPSQQLMTAVWIATRLWADRPDAAIRVNSTGLCDEFVRIFTDMTGHNKFDHLSRMVLTLDTLPLPNKDQIFPFLQHFSDENLIRMLGSEKYLEDLLACFRLEYSRLRDNYFVHRATHHFPEVLTALTETVNSDLPRFKAMAQTLILKSHDNVRIVRRLLRNNGQLKFAAAQSWPGRIAKNHDRGHETEMDPEAVLDLLEKLTMAVAVTPSSSPRAAYKDTFKMYIFLHRIGAPINPIIGRALWHAGVTRYQQQGAPSNQVKWCLTRVRRIEGENAANRLLWSAGYRMAFVKDFLDTLSETEFRTERIQFHEDD